MSALSQSAQSSLRRHTSLLNSVGHFSLLLILSVVFLLTLSTSALGARFQVEGVSGELQDNVLSFLSSIPEPRSDELENYRDLLKKTSAEALQALGYYEPKINLTVEKVKNEYSATIRVITGNPVRVTQLDIQLQGDAKKDPDFQKIMNDPLLKRGDIFHHGTYEELKSRFTELAISKGYFDALWKTAKVEISIQKKSARIHLNFDSKQRYRFGEVTISGASKLEEIIRATQNFNRGDPYSAAEMALYNANLNDTNFFRSVVVQPDLDNLADGSVPIIVQAVPHSRNIISVGAGLSTDIGPRGTLKWTMPRLNSAGHSVISNIEVSEPEQNYIVSYKIPIEDAHQNYGLLQTGFQNKNRDDTKIQKYTLQAKRQTQLSSKWERAYLLRYEREDFIQGRQKDISRMILPGISFTRDRSRGGLNVFWGDSFQIILEVSDPIWRSDVQLLKARSRSKLVRTSGERNQHKFIGRADIGAISVRSIFDVPASMRFFTGGDQSIRGFKYETIAPRDDQGLLIGGKYLAAGSLEYGYLLFENWRAATFVDIGTATNNFKEPLSVGSGVGLRWITPVGPLRLDLAFALSEPGKPWMIHFSMGPDI
ncbi:MAG TPA: autotransporter assembly complex family protein [Geopsychrobacteraceae bacterium]|nr:autotransporter assembly complex family protein [Geopsychrobacteraceae bacterium]